METLIPAAAYHDPAIFAREQCELFSRIWQWVGFTRDLAKSNDFVSREIGGRSIVVQNFDGELRAFQNICSHRFNRIQTAPRGNRPLQCAYHGWTYDATGKPTGIPKRPRFDGLTEAKLCDLRLESWRVECCGQAVFVCRDARGPSLREFLGDAFGTVEQVTHACGPQIDENVMLIRANWKVLVENTLESYHVHFVHPTTFSRLGAGDGTFQWQPPHSTWTTNLGATFAARLERVMPFYESRPWRTPGYFHQMIFPNVTLASTHGTSFSIQFFEPLGPGETRLTSMVFQTRLDELSVAAKAAVEAMNGSIREFNRTVFGEDKDVCEQVQRGAAETTQAGLLSDEEARVFDFQKRYVEWMGSQS